MEKKEIQNIPQIDFKIVCENLYEAVHITDGEGRILFVNDAYTRNTGIPFSEIEGRTVAEIEKEGKLYKGSVTARVLETKERVDSVATIIGMDKEVLVTGIPVFDDDGEIKYVLTNTRDFTELVMLERQLQNMEEEQRRANEELAYLRRRQTGDKHLIYRSRAMAMVAELIQSIADTDANILITGESGTGKELIANAIYQSSNRSDKPFIKVNCAAIPSELLESELFGYEGGAFTGAKASGKPGLFELADTGIIMLDEIGDLPLALQAKLLRVLQQKELMRVGGSAPIKLDVRVIAATNKDLLAEVENGRFRKDLYYRLNVVPIELQPLRERKEDIPALANAFCKSFSEKYEKNMFFSPEGMTELVSYDWPGNIRELENIVERMVVTNPSDTIFGLREVCAALNLKGKCDEQTPDTDLPLKEQVAQFEKSIIMRTIKQEGSIRKAAKVLGVDHSTLSKKCSGYKQDDKDIIDDVLGS